MSFGMLATMLSLATFPARAASQPLVQTLSPGEFSARDAQVAVDADGDAVAVFFYGDDILYPGSPAYCKRDDFGEETDDCTFASRAWSPDGTLSPLQDLSARFSGVRPQGDVAMDGDGRAVAVWRGTSRWGGTAGIVARVRSATGSWSGDQVLSPPEFDPQVAIGGDDRAVVVWRHHVPSGLFGTYEVQARTRSADGTLSAVQDLSAPGVDTWYPRVAVDADGDALFVWQAKLDGSGGPWTLQARARSADGTLSPVQNVSLPGVDGLYPPQVAVDAQGNALVVWHEDGGIHARARTAAGVLAPVQALGPSVGGGDPRLAMIDDGRAVVVWDGQGVVRARARSAAGTWSSVEIVSLPLSLGGGFGADVGMDAAGRALVVWTRSDFASLYEPLQMRSRSPEGVWSSVRYLSDARAITWQGRVDVSPAGRAAVVWEDYGSPSDHRDPGPAIRGAALSLDDLPPDVTPPETSITAGPRRITTKRTVTFRFRANEAWSTFRCRLDGGNWRRCSSPKRYRNLALGRHVFRVRAVDLSGNVDATPARWAFRIVRG